LFPGPFHALLLFVMTVAAIYENGVFRPLDRVDLPEATRVEVSVPDSMSEPAALGHQSIREVLSRRYDGAPDDAARIDPARQ
jgi:predicted DNA-binding antitoxin AbrB/MazE fold protein